MRENFGASFHVTCDDESLHLPNYLFYYSSEIIGLTIFHRLTPQIHLVADTFEKVGENLLEKVTKEGMHISVETKTALLKVSDEKEIRRNKWLKSSEFLTTEILLTFFLFRGSVTQEI